MKKLALLFNFSLPLPPFLRLISLPSFYFSPSLSHYFISSIPLFLLSFFLFILFVFFSHTPLSLLPLIITIITTLKGSINSEEFEELRKVDHEYRREMVMDESEKLKLALDFLGENICDCPITVYII